MPVVDRDAIERSDFPVGRRGYDQAAVHEHLRRVADEMDALRARPPSAAAPSPLAAGASEQVRAILEAAEASAAGLRAGADEHVTRVETATGDMLERLGSLERELGGLLEALRRSGERLNEGLAKLHGEVGTAPAPEAPVPAPAEPVAAPEPEAVTAPEPEAVAAPEPEAATDGATNADEAGARLIALNMALGGTPREETARYLAEHFQLADPEGLLDDVYARAGG